MGADDLLTVQAMVLGTALIGLCASFGSSRLRVHGMALATSGGVWVIAVKVILPAFAGSSAESAIGAAVPLDGCAFLLAGVHLLLCIALGLEAMRGSRP